MSKKKQAKKSEKQAVEKAPIELSDGRLDDVQGGGAGRVPPVTCHAGTQMRGTRGTAVLRSAPILCDRTPSPLAVGWYGARGEQTTSERIRYKLVPWIENPIQYGFPDRHGLIQPLPT